MMSPNMLFSSIYSMGADQCGSIATWEETLESWAKEYEAELKKQELERNRFNPDYRPTAEDVPGQAALMAMGGPAPLREKKQ